MAGVADLWLVWLTCGITLGTSCSACLMLCLPACLVLCLPACLMICLPACLPSTYPYFTFSCLRAYLPATCVPAAHLPLASPSPACLPACLLACHTPASACLPTPHLLLPACLHGT